MTRDESLDHELLDLVNGDSEFALKLLAVRRCQEWLEEKDDVETEAPPADLREILGESSGEIPVQADRAGLRFRFGHYTIVGLLGQGGMGIVYEAWDEPLNRRVALKLLRSGAFLTDSEALARFQREARLPSSLNHPGICTVYDAGVVDGTPYIAMAYLKGETLANKLNRVQDRKEGEPDAGDVPFPEGIEETIRIIERVARSLHCLHEAGLVHRDIKPTNIMVTEEGDPVILDFGLARPEQTEAEKITRTGNLLGTPAYLPPEQIAGGNSPDRRGDIYSLAVTLYECLTGKLPFVAPTRERLFQRVLKESPPDPSRVNHKIPRDLRIVLETALEKDPVCRYQTALDFAEDLRRVHCHETIRARPTSLALRLGRWVQRNPVLTAFMLSTNVFLLVSLVLLGMVVDRIIERDRFLEVIRTDTRADLNDLWANEQIRFVRVSAEKRSLILGNGQAIPASHATRERITYGVYTVNEPIEMLETWTPLAAALERGLSTELSRPVLVDFVVFKDYDVGREEFIKGLVVDFMRLGPASWIRVKKIEPDAVLLAKMKHEGPFKGCIFTHKKSGITGFVAEQIRGRNFAFADKNSTLGNFHPKEELLGIGLRREDLGPDTDNFDTHKQAIAAVVAGRCDLGSAKRFWVDQAIREGKPLEILRDFETTPIPFVAVHGLSPEIREALSRVLVGLDDSEALRTLREHADETITGFQSATDEDFERVVRAIRASERFDSAD